MYYYQARPEGDRVVKEYVPAAIGKYAAILDEESREKREADRAALKAAQSKRDEVETALAELDSLADAAFAGAFLAAGYHDHKGQWRKRRHV
jgi:hypothetical protein